MKKTLLYTFFLFLVLGQESLYPLSKCYGSCVICSTNEPSTCSGKQFVQCTKGYDGAGCALKQSYITQFKAMDKNKASVNGDWADGKTVKCSYKNSLKQQKPVYILGIYSSFDYNEVKVAMQPHYQNFIASFNLIRSSWMPYGDLLRLAVIDQQQNILNQYYIEFMRRQQINPKIQPLVCNGSHLINQKYQIQGSISALKHKILTFKFQGMMFSEAIWGITNLKIVFGCAGFLMFDGALCQKCQNGFYPAKNIEQDVIACEPCDLNCQKCKQNGKCTQCMPNFKLQNSKCTSSLLTKVLQPPQRQFVCGKRLFKLSQQTHSQQRLSIPLNSLPSHKNLRLTLNLAYSTGKEDHHFGFNIFVDGKKQKQIPASVMQAQVQKQEFIPRDVCEGFGTTNSYALYKITTGLFGHESDNAKLEIVGKKGIKFGVQNILIQYQEPEKPKQQPKPQPPPKSEPAVKTEPTSQAEPPKPEPPKTEQSKPEPPKVEPTLKSESTPKAESTPPPKVQTPKVEPPKAEQSKAEPPKVEEPKVDATPKTEPIAKPEPVNPQKPKQQTQPQVQPVPKKNIENATPQVKQAVDQKKSDPYPKPQQKKKQTEEPKQQMKNQQPISEPKNEQKPQLDKKNQAKASELPTKAENAQPEHKKLVDQNKQPLQPKQTANKQKEVQKPNKKQQQKPAQQTKSKQQPAEQKKEQQKQPIPSEESNKNITSKEPTLSPTAQNSHINKEQNEGLVKEPPISNGSTDTDTDTDKSDEIKKSEPLKKQENQNNQISDDDDDQDWANWREQEDQMKKNQEKEPNGNKDEQDKQSKYQKQNLDSPTINISPLPSPLPTVPEPSNSNTSSNSTPQAPSSQLSKIAESISKLQKNKWDIEVGLKVGRELVISLYYPMSLEHFPYFSAKLKKANKTIIPTTHDISKYQQQLLFDFHETLIDESIEIYMLEHQPKRRSLQKGKQGLGKWQSQKWQLTQIEHLAQSDETNKEHYLGSVHVRRFDHLGVQAWNQIDRFSGFFEVVSWITIILVIFLSFLGNSVILQNFVILLQILFLHTYIFSEYLPINFKYIIGGLHRMQNLNFLHPQMSKKIEQWLLGNVIQFSPIKYTMYTKDINFSRAVYPCIIINIAYLLWFIVLNLVKCKIEPYVQGEDDGEQKSGCKLSIVHLAERVNNFWYQVWQYQYIVFIWALATQFYNVLYPEGADRSSLPNFILCGVVIVLVIGLPIWTFFYIRSKYYRIDYFEYNYWFQNIFYLQLQSCSIPTSHHRIHILVRNLRYICLILCFSFLSNYLIQSITLLMLNNLLYIVYVRMFSLYTKRIAMITTILENVLLILLEIGIVVAFAFSDRMQTQGYVFLGYGLIFVALAAFGLGLANVAYLGWRKLGETVGRKERSTISQQEDKE